MKNKLPKLLAFFALLFLGGLLNGQTQQSGTPTPVMPKFNTTEEKEAWIKAHPVEYNQILIADTVNNSVTTVATAPAANTETQPAVVPGFPQYVNTGNKEKDDADYAAAKAAWIQANPEKYAEMTGQPK